MGEAPLEDDIDTYGLEMFSDQFLTQLEQAEAEFPSSFCAGPPSSMTPVPEDLDDEYDGLFLEPCSQEMLEALDEGEQPGFVPSQRQPGSVRCSLPPMSSLPCSESESRGRNNELLSVGARIPASEFHPCSTMVPSICIKTEPPSPTPLPFSPLRPVKTGAKRKRYLSDTESDSSEDDQIGFKKPKLPPPATHLEDFFSSYSKYEYDPSGPASQQFQELRKVYKWTKSDMQAETAYTQYSRALSQTFSQKYGDDVNSLRNWRRLCRTVAIVPVPKSLKGCQRAIEDSHVNLMDLLDIHTTGEPVRRFKTEKELSAYTKKTNKTFPRADIPKGSLLYFLLRRIRCPPAENLVRRDGRWVERDS